MKRPQRLKGRRARTRVVDKLELKANIEGHFYCYFAARRIEAFPSRRALS